MGMVLVAGRTPCQKIDLCLSWVQFQRSEAAMNEAQRGLYCSEPAWLALGDSPGEGLWDSKLSPGRDSSLGRIVGQQTPVWEGLWKNKLWPGKECRTACYSLGRILVWEGLWDSKLWPGRDYGKANSSLWRIVGKQTLACEGLWESKLSPMKNCGKASSSL